MNEEPKYEFVKGQGWIPMFERKLLAFDVEGKAVWLIDRKPEIGELYLGYNFEGDPWYENGMVDLSQAVEHMETNAISELHGIKDSLYAVWDGYVTVVPCDG